MADKKLNEVTKVTDMAYVPVIMADGSVGQIAKSDLASVVAGVVKDYTAYLGTNDNVKPYSRWGNLDISEDSSRYGKPVSANVVNINSTDGVICKIASSSSIYIFSHSVESVVIRVLYRQ